MQTGLISTNVQIDQLRLCAGKEKMSNTNQIYFFHVPKPMEVGTKKVMITVLGGYKCVYC